MKLLLVLLLVFVLCVGCTKEGMGTEKMIEYVPENMISGNSLDVIKNERASEEVDTTPSQQESEEDSIFYKMPEDKINKLLYEDIKVLIEKHNFYDNLRMGNAWDLKEEVRTGRYPNIEWYYRLHIDGIETLSELQEFCKSIYTGDLLEIQLKGAFFEQDGYLCMYDVVGSSDILNYETMFDVTPDSGGVWASFLGSGCDFYGFYGSAKKVYFVIEDEQVKIAKIIAIE